MRNLIFVRECYHMALYNVQVIDSENWSLLLTNTERILNEYENENFSLFIQSFENICKTNS